MKDKVLVFGGSGLVASKFIQKYNRDLEIKAPTIDELDIRNIDQVKRAAEEFSPDVIINFAAFTNVEAAENQKGQEEEICYQINAVGAKNVALVTKQLDKRLIHISTEYVFDGTKAETPYTEKDEPNPTNWYGTTKLFGEEFVKESQSRSIVVRISMPFSSFYQEKKDIARFFLGELNAGRKITAIEDQRICPTFVSDIADALNQFVVTDTQGLFHVCSTDSVTPLEFAKTLAELFSLDYSLINSVNFDEYSKRKKAKLLKNSWLNPTKFELCFGDQILHTVEEGLGLFKKEIDDPLNRS